MDTRGLLVRLEARPGKDNDIEDLLQSALPLVQQEAATTAWFGIRFGRSEYGIFDVFPDEEAREAHLSGPVTQALQQEVGKLFAAPPKIQKLDVLAEKLPVMPDEVDTKGLLLTFKAKAGHEHDVEEFLRYVQPMVMEEQNTTAWFAIHLAHGEYGIFDTFPDNGSRFEHLIGHVPRELAKNVFSLMGSMPEMEMLGVTAEKLGA
jgi:quinol monooxygenase YgiN